MATEKWTVVQTGDKLYLYASDLEAREKLMRMSRYTRPNEPARPMSKSDCLRLARTLLDFAVN